MTSEPSRDLFLAHCQQYFHPLCTHLSLSIGEPEFIPGFASVSATAGNVRVFFDSDRGLCSFGIGAQNDVRPLCEVETIAARFPRVRVMSEGIQRLSLDEQASFLEAHWQDLQVMFSPAHLRETRKWRR